MIIIIENTPERVVFEKTDRNERWWDSCSDESILKHCNREGEKIKKVKWEDGKHIASLLNVYFEIT